MSDQHERQQALTRVDRSKGVTTPQSTSSTARPAIRDALRARSTGSPVGSHSTYKQRCCLLNGAVLARGAEKTEHVFRRCDYPSDRFAASSPGKGSRENKKSLR